MPETQTPVAHTSRRRIFRVAAAVLGTACIIAVLAVSMPAIQRQLHRWDLLPVSQSLTELYIEDAESLPESYKPGEAVGTTFAITNRTDSFRSYQYRVVQTDSKGGQVVELLHSRVEIAPGYTTSIDTSVIPQDRGKRSNIRIELVNESLSVNYWLDRK